MLVFSRWETSFARSAPVSGSAAKRFRRGEDEETNHDGHCFHEITFHHAVSSSRSRGAAVAVEAAQGDDAAVAGGAAALGQAGGAKVLEVIIGICGGARSEDPFETGARGGPEAWS